MTDEQIIKALECCATDKTDDCFQCPYDKMVYNPGYDWCADRCRKDALDLINRQKTEIERLTAKILVKDNINDYNTAQLRIAREELKTVKSNAIKKFCKRLKKELRLDDDCSYDCENCCFECKEFVPQIDNIIKEMTEEEK